MTEAISRPNHGRIDSIQALRAFAAMAVVVHHSFNECIRNGYLSGQGVASRMGELGAAGVDIFFVISGFIIYSSTRKSFESSRGPSLFLWNRASRIFPLYWMVTVVYLLAKLSGKLFKSANWDVTYVLGSLLLIPTYNMNLVPPTPHPVVDQGWSLSHELLFYALFAFGMFFLKRKLTVLLASGLLVALMLLEGLWGWHNAVANVLGSHLNLEFVFGMGLGIYHEKRGIPAAAGIAMGFLAAIAFIVPAMLGYGMPQERALIWGLPAAALVAGGLSLRSSLPRRLVFWGDASYALYLVHGLATISLGALLAKGTQISLWILIPGTVMIGMALGGLLHTYVERPVTEALKSIGGRIVGRTRA